MSSSAKPNGCSLRLLSGWFCPYAQRAWIAAEEKMHGAYTLVDAIEIGEDQKYIKSDELIDANRNGLIPTIIDTRTAGGHDGTAGGHGGGSARSPSEVEVVTVSESMICVEYIDETCSEGGSLLPGGPAMRARSRMWSDFCTKQVIAQFYRLLMLKEPAGREHAAASIKTALATFSAEIKGPFFLGDRFTYVDVSLAPWMVARMCVLSEYRGFCVPDTPEYAKFHKWCKAVEVHPSYAATVADRARLLWSYKRYADGTAESQVGDAVRNGTAMP